MRITFRERLTILSMVILWLFFVSCASATYKFTDLHYPWFGVNERTYAHGINDSGEVVGRVKFSGGHQHACVWWSDGTFTDLDDDFGGYYVGTYASAINSSDQIVGWGKIGYLWHDGVATEIDPGISGPGSRAKAINNLGQVVGWYIDGSFRSHGFFWDDGNFTIFDVHSEVHGINDSGQAVGWGFWGSPHARLWVGDTCTDLGVPPGCDYSYAYGINNSGEVVGYGYSLTDSTSRAFLLSGGTFIDLHPPWGLENSRAYSINDYGQVVGYAHVGSTLRRAFLWSDGEFIGISPPWAEDNSVAYGINNAGHVVGEGGGHAYVAICTIDLEDLAYFAAEWLASGGEADLDGSGRVGFIDLGILSSFWLDYCPNNWPWK